MIAPPPSQAFAEALASAVTQTQRARLWIGEWRDLDTEALVAFRESLGAVEPVTSSAPAIAVLWLEPEEGLAESLHIAADGSLRLGGGSLRVAPAALEALERWLRSHAPEVSLAAPRRASPTSNVGEALRTIDPGVELPPVLLAAPWTAVLGEVTDEAAAKGLAILLDHRLQSRSTAALLRERLDEATRARLDPFAPRHRALAWLLRGGDAPAVPRGMRSLGVAQHGHFGCLHNDDELAVAYDGQRLRWFGRHEGDRPIVRRTTIASHAGRVLVDRDRAHSFDPATGEERVEKRPGLVRRLFARSLDRPAWERELAGLAHKHLGMRPGREAIPGVADTRWLVAEPSDNDFEAQRCFAHLGVPAPPALLTSHLWLWHDGALHALPRVTGQAEQVAMAEPAAMAVAPTGSLHLIAVDAEGLRWQELTVGAAPQSRAKLGLVEDEVVSIRSMGRDLLVVSRDPFGDQLLRASR
ncbi:MAG: hypothetical protein KC731_12745 [Myxococcales bacterium]|nr:hypothetical protein [Myxococcales bacterium]